MSESDEPEFDKPTSEQVHAAIRRQVQREADGDPRAWRSLGSLSPGESLGRSELARFADAAQALAILAVQCLAEERSTSVEAVLDQLIEYP